MRKLSTEDVKRRIHDVHGLKYDLSNLVYQNRRTKIELICPNHGSWLSVSEHIFKGGGCPTCAGKIVNHVNSFGDNFKDILSEWDYNKNPISPYEISYGSNKKVWWICPKNHSYDMAPKQRTISNPQGCPFCSNMRVGESNSIATLKSEWISEWNFDRNAENNPFNIGIQSNQKIWWKCDKGHEWFVSPNSRITYDTGCPNCAKSGYKTELIGYLYLHKIIINNKVGLKYGITNNPAKRITQLIKKNERLTDDDITITNLFIFKGDGDRIQFWEREISKKYGRNFFSFEELPDGYTETIQYTRMKIYEIYSYLEKSNLDPYYQKFKFHKLGLLLNRCLFFLRS